MTVLYSKRISKTTISIFRKYYILVVITKILHFFDILRLFVKVSSQYTFVFQNVASSNQVFSLFTFNLTPERNYSAREHSICCYFGSLYYVAPSGLTILYFNHLCMSALSTDWTPRCGRIRGLY